MLVYTVNNLHYQKNICYVLCNWKDLECEKVASSQVSTYDLYLNKSVHHHSHIFLHCTGTEML